MAKQPKPKAKGERNDSRKNGKANKKGNVRHKGVSITPIQAILLGGGLLRNVEKRWKN